MRRGGFTLVELVVVVVLIVVLASMAIPRMLSSGSTTRIRESAGRLATAARCARETAVLQQCPVRLVLDGSKNRFRLEAQPPGDGPAARYAGMGANFGRDEALDEGVRFESSRIEPAAPRFGDDAERAFITFYPNGQADAAAVRLTDGRRTWSLLVHPHSGRVELLDHATTDLPNDQVDLDA